MTRKNFLTRIISAIMALTIIVSCAAHTRAHAFEDPTYYKAEIKKDNKNQYELIIDGRKINEATLTSIWGKLASLDGFEITRERIISSFNLNPNDYKYTYLTYKDINLLNCTFTAFFPESNPEMYTTQEKNDMVNIKFFANFFLLDLWKIQKNGTTLYCSMF